MRELFTVFSGLIRTHRQQWEGSKMGRNIFYIIGVIVVVIAVLSLVGLA